MLLNIIRKSAFLVIVLISAQSNSEELRSKSNLGVSVSQIYTDNRCLVKEGKEDEWLTRVSLDSGNGLGYSREGARASLNVDASLQINAQDIDRNDCDTTGSTRSSRLSPRLKADGNVELIEQTAFLDVSAVIRESSIDPFSISDENNLTTRENRNTTYSYKVSPYFTGRVKDVAQGILRFTYDDQFNSEDEVEDSSRQSAKLSIDSISNSRLSWGVSGDYSRDSYDNNNSNQQQDNDFASASAKVGYRLSRKWRVNATTGKEFNDYDSVLNENDGSFWKAGVNWTPTPRTSVEAEFGERFFGSSDSLSITHKTRRSRFSADYDKTLTSSRRLREEDLFFNFTDDQGNPIVDQNGQFATFSSVATTLTRSPIINERYKLGYTLEGRRTTVALNSSLSKQFRTEDGYSSEFSDISLHGDRRVSRDLKFKARISYRERTADAGSEILGSDSHAWIYSVGASREFGRRTTLSLDYTLTDRRSDNDEDEYKENRFMVTVKFDL